MHRIKVLRAKTNGQHGSINISASYTNYLSSSSKRKDKTSVKLNIDSTQEVNKKKLHEELATVCSASIHYMMKTNMREKMSVSAADTKNQNDNFDMLENTKNMQEFGLVIQRGIHSGLGFFQ